MYYSWSLTESVRVNHHHPCDHIIGKQRRPHPCSYVNSTNEELKDRNETICNLSKFHKIRHLYQTQNFREGLIVITFLISENQTPKRKDNGAPFSAGDSEWEAFYE